MSMKNSSDTIGNRTRDLPCFHFSYCCTVTCNSVSSIFFCFNPLNRSVYLLFCRSCMYDTLFTTETYLLINDVNKLFEQRSSKGWNSSLLSCRLICCRNGFDVLVLTSAIGWSFSLGGGKGATVGLLVLSSHIDGSSHIGPPPPYLGQHTYNRCPVHCNFVMVRGYRGCYESIGNMGQKMSWRILNILLF
jgi:hypothetical protein